jgi:hypothetical protein
MQVDVGASPGTVGPVGERRGQLPLSIVFSFAHDGTGGTLRHRNHISSALGGGLSTLRLTHVHVCMLHSDNVRLLPQYVPSEKRAIVSGSVPGLTAQHSQQPIPRLLAQAHCPASARDTTW